MSRLGRVDVRAVEQDRARVRAPGMSAFIRLIERSNVDLPQPDGPMNAVTIVRGATRSEMSKSACFSPYQNEKSRSDEAVRRCGIERGGRGACVGGAGVGRGVAMRGHPNRPVM